MDKPPAPATQPATSTDPGAEALAVLLNLLRNANREVQAPTLNPKADAAVKRFQAIANDLATTRPFAGPLPPPPSPIAAAGAPAPATPRRGA